MIYTWLEGGGLWLQVGSGFPPKIWKSSLFLIWKISITIFGILIIDTIFRWKSFYNFTIIKIKKTFCRFSRSVRILWLACFFNLRLSTIQVRTLLLLLLGTSHMYAHFWRIFSKLIHPKMLIAVCNFVKLNPAWIYLQWDKVLLACVLVQLFLLDYCLQRKQGLGETSDLFYTCMMLIL